MSKYASLSMVLAVVALGMATPVLAQTRSAVSSMELDAAVAERPNAVREAVRDLLGSERAHELADGMGVSVSELSSRIAGLDDASLIRIAEMAETNGEALAGGDQTIVISATTVVIILLLIIILTR